MPKIDYVLEIGYPGCQDEGTMDVPDDMTTEQIDMLVYEMATEHAQSWIGDSRLGFDPDASEEEQEQEEEFFMDNVCGSWSWHKD